MEFYISTSDMQRVIRLMGVVAKSNTKDSTGRILIEADEDNSILFLSNDGAHAISVTPQNVIVKNPGILSIEYSQIKQFVNSFVEWEDSEGFGAKGFNFVANDLQNVYIEIDNVHENGKKSKGKLKLKGYDALGDRKPKGFGTATFILNSRIFKAAADKVMYAVDMNKNVAHIRGMNVRFNKDNIYFAGTDGAMLSEYKIKNITDLEEGSFILKPSFVMSLKRALLEECQMFFEFSDRNIRVKFDDVYFSGTHVIGHEYPDYSSSLDEFTDIITVDKNVLTSLLSPMLDILDNSDYNRMTFAIKDRRLFVYTDEVEFEYDGDIEYEGVFEVDLNGISMNQSLSVIKDDKIALKFSDSDGFLIMDSVNFEDQRSLIVPIERRG